jgi:N-acetylglucosamine malate deacetylase 1
MKRICVIAPHPDDELLGAGGSLLKEIDMGGEVFWLIVTTIAESAGYTAKQVSKREHEIEDVAKKLPFSDVINLGIPTTTLDSIPGSRLISDIKVSLDRWRPDTVIIPWRNDAHTDHQAVFDASFAATKTFRAPYVSTVLAMEILSETNFSRLPGFIPNWYIDISDYMERKIELARIYEDEFSLHPFPRSEENVRALATLRGSESGFNAAEAFYLIKHLGV